MTNAPKIPFPRTELSTFPLVLGTNTFSWTADRDATFRILDEFWQNGGNFIDTADSYPHWAPGRSGGETETLIGQWIESRGRNKLMVATKSSNLEGVRGRSRTATTRAVEGSLQRLHLDHLDVFYYHYDDLEVPIAEQVEIAQDLIADGKIRYLALSNYAPDRMAEFFRLSLNTPAQPVALQPHYNLLHRYEFETSVLPMAQVYKAATFPYFTLAAGVLTGKYTSLHDLEGVARESMARKYMTTATLPVIRALKDIAARRDVAPASIALAWVRAQGATAPIASVSAPEQLPALLESTVVDLNAQEVYDLNKVSEPFAQPEQD